MHLPPAFSLGRVSGVLVAGLALVAALRWAAPVFIPLLLGALFSYALSPLVDQLQRLRVPRGLAAAVLVAAVVGGLGSSAYALGDEAAALVEALPRAAQKVRETLRERRSHQETALDKVQQAASQLEQAAQEGAASRPPTAPRGVTRVQIEKPRFDVKEYLWTGTIGLFAAAGQAMVVIFITFFLLAAGDTFKRKLVRIAGPTMSRKRITVQMLDEIDGQIQRYLWVQVATSVAVGLATWGAYAALGIDNSALWGVIAAVLNLVPYAGAIFVTGASALVAFLQFASVDMALAVAGASAAIHVVCGYLLTPWLTSRTSRLNAVAVFVGVLAFGWLWGAWGLLLGVPALMIVKAVCDRVDELQPIGELLG